MATPAATWTVRDGRAVWNGNAFAEWADVFADEFDPIGDLAVRLGRSTR